MVSEKCEYFALAPQSKRRTNDAIQGCRGDSDTRCHILAWRVFERSRNHSRLGPCNADLDAAPDAGNGRADALRSTAGELYRSVQERDYRRTYQLYSPHCQAELSESDLVRMLDHKFRDKDVSGQIELTVDVHETTATVVARRIDGPGTMEITNWTFTEGYWRFDTC